LHCIGYAENGMSGHPDHVRAHQATMAALVAVREEAVPPTLYYTALSRSGLRALHDAATDPGQWLSPVEIGTDDALITTVVDVSDHVDTKYEALRAHASQSDATALLSLGGGNRIQAMGRERFIRVHGRPSARFVDSELFPAANDARALQ
jgi:LmbE family N-acetylglucosaminyl deacetylase